MCSKGFTKFLKGMKKNSKDVGKIKIYYWKNNIILYDKYGIKCCIYNVF